MGTQVDSHRAGESKVPEVDIVQSGMANMMVDLGVSRLEDLARDRDCDPSRGSYNFSGSKIPANRATPTEREKSSAWKEMTKDGIHDDDFTGVEDLDQIANGQLHRMSRAAAQSNERRGLRARGGPQYDVMDPRPHHRNKSKPFAGSNRRPAGNYHLENITTRRWDSSPVPRLIQLPPTKGSIPPDAIPDSQNPQQAISMSTALSGQLPLPAPMKKGLRLAPGFQKTETAAEENIERTRLYTPTKLKFTQVPCTSDRSDSFFEAEGTRQHIIEGDVVQTPLKVRVYELPEKPRDSRVWILEIIQDQMGSMKLDVRSVKRVVLDGAIAYIVPLIRTEDVLTYCGDVKFPNLITAMQLKTSCTDCRELAKSSKATIFGPEITEWKTLPGTQGDQVNTSRPCTPQVQSPPALHPSQQLHGSSTSGQNPVKKLNGSDSQAMKDIDTLAQLTDSSQRNSSEDHPAELSPRSQQESEDLIDFGPEEPYDLEIKPMDGPTDLMHFAEHRKAPSAVVNERPPQDMLPRLHHYESGLFNYFADGIDQIYTAYPTEVSNHAPTNMSVSYLWTVDEFRHLSFEEQNEIVAALSQRVSLKLVSSAEGAGQSKSEDQVFPMQVLLRLRNPVAPCPQEILDFNQYIKCGRCPQQKPYSNLEPSKWRGYAAHLALQDNNAVVKSQTHSNDEVAAVANQEGERSNGEQGRVKENRGLEGSRWADSAGSVSSHLLGNTTNSKNELHQQSSDVGSPKSDSTDSEVSKLTLEMWKKLKPSTWA